MNTREITQYIEDIKRTARDDMTHIHLRACDFERVNLCAGRHGCIKQPDGRITTVFNGKLIDVVGVR